MSNGTRAPKTIVTYPIEADRLEYYIPFEYLARKYIVVTVYTTAYREVLRLNVDYRFSAVNKISLLKDISAWSKIEIRRNTSASDRLVEFKDGSILRAGDLNLSQIQTLHVAEEARDLAADGIITNDQGLLDARGRRITNLASGVDASDAVALRQLWAYDTSTLNNANAAQEAARLSASHRAESEKAANAAATYRTASEDAAKLSASHRAESEKAAGLSASHRLGSEEAARVSMAARDTILNTELTSLANAQKAETEANRAFAHAQTAKEEADKLVNNNAFMGLVESVYGKVVTYKQGVQQRITTLAAGKVYAESEFISDAPDNTFNGMVYVRDTLKASGLHVYGRNTDLTKTGQHIIWNTQGLPASSTLFVNNIGNGVGGYTFQIIQADQKELGRFGITNDGSCTATGSITAAKDLVASVDVRGVRGIFSGSVTGTQGNFSGGPVYGKSGDFTDFVNTDRVVSKSVTCADTIVASSIVSRGSVHAGGDTASGTLYASGNIGGSIWGGPLSEYLGRAMFTTAGNRVKGWTGVGSGFLNLTVDGVAVGINFTTSDENRKEAIREHKMTDTITDVFRAIKSVSYKFKDTVNSETGEVVEGHRSRFGFITQNIETVWPEAVHHLEDGSGMTNTNEMIGGLVAMVKRLDERCVALERALEALRS